MELKEVYLTKTGVILALLFSLFGVAGFIAAFIDSPLAVFTACLMLYIIWLYGRQIYSFYKNYDLKRKD